MSKAGSLSEAQYASVYEAMEQSELGRLFLEEHVKRESVVNAAQVLAALDGIRDSSFGDNKTGTLDILRRELQEMSASIMQTRQEIAAIKPEEPGNNRIMAATEEDNADLVIVLIESTKNQLTIRQRARRYRGAPEDSLERGVLRTELADLVRKQVDIDLAVQELKLVSLRHRLGKQEARLAQDHQRKDELAAKKLERILSGKRERSGRRERPGPPGRRRRPRGLDEDF